MYKYNKLIYALLVSIGVAITVLYTALDDDVISGKEWVNILSTFLIPITVYFAPKNKEDKAVE